MSATQTSRMAYGSILYKIGDCQLKVLKVIERHSVGVTNLEICRELGWPINRITPRVLELRTAGVVAKVGKARDPETKKWGTVWGRVRENQAELF